MKKIILAAFFCLLAGWVFGQKQGDTVYVAVKSAPLKASTGFFAKTVGNLRYGDQITVIAVNGKWAQVRAAANRSLTGWIAAANVTSKRIVAGSGQAASAKELAMAGKGFSQGIEQDYKTGKNLNYDAVDALEQVTVSDNELFYFIEEGRLAMGD